MSLTTCLEEQLRQQHSLRAWLQKCGCSMDRGCNGLQYFGEDCHLFEIGVFEQNIQGSLMPIRILKGNNGDWCHVGNVERPPGRQRFALNYFEACKPFLPYFHALGRNPFHIYELVGDCSNPSDPANGWGAYVLIYSGIRLEQRRSSTRTTRASQAPLDNQLLGTVDQTIFVAPLRLDLAFDGQGHNINLLTRGIAFDCRSCPSCGSGCTGCASCQGLNLPACAHDRYYVLLQNDSNGDIFVELYANDLGQVSTYFVAHGTDSLGCKITATDIVVMDGHVAVSTSGNSNCAGLYTAQIGANGDLSPFHRALPGSIQSLDVAGGTLLMGGALDGVAGGKILSSRGLRCNRISESIRFSSDATFNDIDSCGSMILAGGTGGLAVSSTNGGLTWRILATPTSDEITAVGVCGADFWIGTVAGDLYTSCNQGHSWHLVASVEQSAQYQLTRDQDGGAIRNIEFAGKHVGYFSSGNELYGTYSGGAYWSKDCPRFEMSASMKHTFFPTPHLTLPPLPHTYAKLAIPTCAEPFDASNRFAVAVNGTMGSWSNIVYAEPMVENMGLNY